MKGCMGKWVVARGLAAVIGMGACGAVSAASDWRLVDIGTLGGPGSYGAAVNNRGDVVGCADTASGAIHAFIHRDGVMRDLDPGGTLPGSSCALAVNDAGVVAGRAAGGELVIWRDAAVEALGVKGDIGGINAAGVVAGTQGEGLASRAFVYANGTLTALGTLNDRDPYANSAAHGINAKGQVVGRSNGRAFLHENGAMRDLGTLGGDGAGATDINARGEVVGMAIDAQGAPNAFVYQAGMKALPTPSYASATAINDAGTVVGSAEGTYGFVVEGGVVTRLDRLSAVVEKGWRRLEPTGINDRGWIVGTGTNAAGELRAFLLIPAAGAEQPLARKGMPIIQRVARGSN